VIGELENEGILGTNSFVTIRRRIYVHHQGTVSKCNKAEMERGGCNLDCTRKTRTIQEESISEDTLRRCVEDVGRQTIRCTWNNVCFILRCVYYLSKEEKAENEGA